VDLWGRLSNPSEAIETVAAQGFAASPGESETVESRPSTAPESTQRTPSEEKGRLSNPIQRRLSPTDTDDLIAAYRSGTTINELAHRYRIHRSTVTATLNRHHVERHHSQTEWTSEILADAADLYASGLALAAVAARYGVDPQTVANRFRRAGIPVRPRRGWPPQHNRN
jgi:lambda repressor-like predicted transcriptional regulator